MNILDEVWLHVIGDFEPDVVARAAQIFDKKDISFMSSAEEEKLMRDIGISGEFAKRVSQGEYLEKAKEIIDYCSANGIRIITRESEEYPASLKEINLPPRLLFLKGGKLPGPGEVSISVVGCRKPSDHGKSFARALGKELAMNNIVTISGMAEGIDGQAHRGSLDGGGKTIAVLAGSVDVIYPQCHEKLYRDILESGGTIVSERPPKTHAKKYFYQQRNRIIVGLSQGTVVVEGKLSGGTSITARRAVDENRDVFAVPGNPLVWQSELPNSLIAEGAIIVTDATVPAKHYAEMYPSVSPRSCMKENKSENNVLKAVSDDEKILEYIRDKGGVSTLEEIADATNISLNILSGRLTILCIKGKLRQESGNRYVLIETWA